MIKKLNLIISIYMKDIAVNPGGIHCLISNNSNKLLYTAYNLNKNNLHMHTIEKKNQKLNHDDL